MSDIVYRLASWKGRRYLEAGFESQGFTAHKVYQALVTSECNRLGVQADISIEEYWDESARESVCSAGIIMQNQRSFDVPHAYRSALLDKLAKCPASPVSAQFKVPSQIKSIHPCLDVFEKRRFADKQFALGLSATVKRAIDVEVKRWPIAGLDRDVSDISVSDVRRHFQQAMLEAGFEQWQKRFIKCITDGILLRAELDISAKSTLASVPVHTVYVDETDHGREYPFLIGSIIPGVAYYGLGGSLAHIRYGLRARAHLLNEFVNSF